MAGKGGDAERVRQLFDLCREETRFRIIEIVRREGHAYVTDLSRRLDVRQNLVSHHLGLLRLASILEARREGKRVFYSLVPGCLEPLARFAAGR